MIRSMYSGISGLKNFQTKLDVIGNNIANVNTYGFKKGRTVFKDLISQTTAGATAPTENRAGVNAKQIGLGSQLAKIDTIHSGGSLQATGNTLDLAISGDGFFQVADGNDGNLEEDRLYTRAGNFYMDSEGYLVNSDGRYLVGEGGSIQIPVESQSMSIGEDGTVTYVNEAGKLIDAGQIQLAKFPNNGGLTKEGSNYYRQSPSSGEPSPGIALTEGLGTISSGFLEMSNVDLSEEFTDMIVAQRGFQANTRIITTSDSILEELINLKR